MEIERDDSEKVYVEEPDEHQPVEIPDQPREPVEQPVEAPTKVPVSV